MAKGYSDTVRNGHGLVGDAIITGDSELSHYIGLVAIEKKMPMGRQYRRNRLNV